MEQQQQPVQGSSFSLERQLQQVVQQQQQMLQQQQQQLSTLQVEIQRLNQVAGASSVGGGGEGSGGRALRPKPPRIPFYGGAESGLEPWLSQAGAILEVSGVDLRSRSAVQYASLYLEGKARTVWDHFVREAQVSGEECTTFADFADLLRKLLGPMNTDVVGRARLRALRQKRDVHSYTETFLKILRSLETPLGDLNAREAFIGGLKPAVMGFVRQKISLHASLKEALEAAQLFDRTLTYGSEPGRQSRARDPEPMDLGVMRTGSPSASASGSPASSRSPSPAPRSPAASSARRTGSPKRRSPSPVPARVALLTDAEREKCLQEGRCFRCRKRGHRKAECPLLTASAQNRRKN